MIETPRLILRRWEDRDRAPFAAMHTDARLKLHRDPSRDFTADFGGGDWHGWMWVARPA
jgi:RimJ/RimL family protein N-acetyltransferase